MPSQHSNKSGFVFILASILLVSAAQLMIKLGMNELPLNLNISMAFPWASTTWIMLGIAGYGLSMLMWMMALSIYQLSFAYPLLSTSYVIVYLGAVLLPQLNESVSIIKTIGILFIVAGVVFVTKSKSLNSNIDT